MCATEKCSTGKFCRFKKNANCEVDQLFIQWDVCYSNAIEAARAVLKLLACTFYVDHKYYNQIQKQRKILYVQEIEAKSMS